MSANRTSSVYTETLPCGLRLIVAPTGGDVAYCGIAINAGTRDELETESGMAHFCEHLTFKGTGRRRSWHILNRMDSVGGDINAFTGKEDTVFYSTFLKEHYARAIDLLIDIVLGSTYPQVEMNKEVEVVIDEIESYKDTPSELIFDEFENLIFSGHPLGRNILGDASALRKMKTADVRRFTDRCYRPDNMVLFMLSDIPVASVRREVMKALQKTHVAVGGDIVRQQLLTVTETPSFLTNKEMGREAVPEYHPQEVVVHRDTHQAHVMMGTRAYAAGHPRYMALYLLNNMLGGPGMNSRLNLSLRERNGLVYTVESNLTAYSDTGIWSVYFGCDVSDVSRCRRLVQRELNRFIEAPVSDKVLEAAKRQIKGQIGVSTDQKEGLAIALGKNFLHYNKIRNIQNLYAKIEAITAEELQQVAQELFPTEHLTTLIYK